MNFICGGKIISSNKQYKNSVAGASVYKKHSAGILENNNNKFTIVQIPPEPQNYNVDQWTPYQPKDSFGINRQIVNKSYPKCEEPIGSPSVSSHTPFVFDSFTKTWCTKQ